MPQQQVSLFKNGKPLLGFTVEYDKGKRQWNGKQPAAIYLEKHHCIVAGTTGLAGKTTLIEGVADRWLGKRIIVFITKRGEKNFAGRRKVPLFYKEGAVWDWQYMLGLIEGFTNTKEKFLREAVMEVCDEEPKTIAQARKVAQQLQQKTRAMIKKSMFYQLDKILKKIEENLHRFSFKSTLDLKEGINVMDIQRLPDELKQMVIAAVADMITDKLNDTILVVPEAYMIIPNDRKTVAIWSVEKLIRTGYTNGNFVIIDSQDTVSIDADCRKPVDNLILGKIRDENEQDRTKRAIKLPGGNKLAPEEVETLRKGQFYVAMDDKVHLIYAMPAWATVEQAIECAKNPDLAYELEQPLVEIEEEEDTEPVIVQEVDEGPQKTIKEKVQDALRERQRQDEQLPSVLGEGTTLQDPAAVSTGLAPGIKPTPSPFHLAECQDRGFHQFEKGVCRCGMTESDFLKLLPIDASQEEEGDNKNKEETSSTDNPPELSQTVEVPLVDITVVQKIVENPRIDDSTLNGRLLAMIVDGHFEHGLAIDEVHYALDKLYGLGSQAPKKTNGAAYMKNKLLPELEKLSHRPYAFLEILNNRWTEAKGARERLHRTVVPISSV